MALVKLFLELLENFVFDLTRRFAHRRTNRLLL
jgi:hypothetical protein